MGRHWEDQRRPHEERPGCLPWLLAGLLLTARGPRPVFVCSCGWSSSSRARAVIHVTVPRGDGKAHNIRGI